MDNEDELSQLEELLRADVNEGKPSDSPKNTEFDFFNTPCEEEVKVTPTKLHSSLVHNGDTDSSDDEERMNGLERKYDIYGSQVKQILDLQQHEQINKKLDFEIRLRTTNDRVKLGNNYSECIPELESSSITKTPSKPPLQCAPESKPTPKDDVYTDPVFGIRIVKPLVSSSGLLDRINGRSPITMSQVKRHVENGDLSNDWVIGGVVVRKSSSKKSQKGSQFMIWTLSDLKNDMKTVSVFLFGKAYKELWKIALGTVVAILNPNALDRSENSADQACLSVESPDRCMILGQSKDLGICKSKKKSGEPCTAFVNLNECAHCIYHVKQEYQKFSKRQELQSKTMGKGLVDIQNKVFGKNTLIYGGKAYSALNTGKNKQVVKNDQNRLMALSDYYKAEGDQLMTNKSPMGAGHIKNVETLHRTSTVKSTDRELLNKLTGHASAASSNTGVTLAQKVASSSKLGLDKSFGLKGSGTINLNISYGQIAAERAKANAINVIKKTGGLSKVDPNNTKGTEAGKKRAIEKLNNSGNEENNSKKIKVNEEVKKLQPMMSDRFRKILEASSAHKNLIEQYEDDEQEKYFNKLEKKESMEEKMLNTFKLACKAVRCAKCKYTAFSAAQRCKDERHPLKVLDTFKRFFKCGNCGNRTVSLELIPLTSCSNCKSSKWEKAPMLREKKVNLSDGLSIRGEEETFIGGQVNAGKNINLLVPDN